MTSLRAEVKTELRCNVCDDITVEEKCDVQCKIERCSSVTVLDLVLF